MARGRSLKEVLISTPPLPSLERSKEAIVDLTVGEDLIPTIKAAKQSSSLEDIKFLTKFFDLTVMDKSIGLSYQVL